MWSNDGKITLRGTVGSLREKREAKKAAERVFGVISVDNQLQVKLMNDERRADAEPRCVVRKGDPRARIGDLQAESSLRTSHAPGAGFTLAH